MRHRKSQRPLRDARLLLGAAVALLGCGGERGDSARVRQARATAALGGQIVSTVDGQAIAVDEVQELARAGLSPRTALRRLEAERLLVAEATRRGLAKRAPVREVARQALVQALLQAEANAVVVSDSEIKAAYEKTLARFERPERRASVHVLAKLPKNPSPAADAAAKEFVLGVLPQLAATEDLDGFMLQQRALKSEQFSVVAERLPAVDTHAALVESYLTAMFSLAQPGTVPQPIRTVYGWHAIRVTQILPKESTPYDTAAVMLRAELLLDRRQHRVQQLIDHLRGQYGVQIPKNAGEALAHIEL
jgi:parvulin-like peptidyl-prolyl isomerase